MRPQIRRIVIQIEEIHNEIGKTVDPPARKTTVAAIIKNPYAGKYVENLEDLLGRNAPKEKVSANMEKILKIVEKRFHELNEKDRTIPEELF